MIYLDSAATTLQKPETVPAAVADAIRTMTTPGRGDHSAARMAADLMLRCRTEAAELFDVPQPENVILTTNATHGLNTAIRSLVKPGDTVVISGYEHNAVTRTLHDIGHVSCRIVNGRLFDRAQMTEGFRRAVDKDAACVICTHTSNVFGYIRYQYWRPSRKVRDGLVYPFEGGPAVGSFGKRTISKSLVLALVPLFSLV